MDNNIHAFGTTVSPVNIRVNSCNMAYVHDESGQILGEYNIVCPYHLDEILRIFGRKVYDILKGTDVANLPENELKIDLRALNS